VPETLESRRASFNRSLRVEGKADRTLVLYGQSITYFSQWMVERGLPDRDPGPVLPQQSTGSVCAPQYSRFARSGRASRNDSGAQQSYRQHSALKEPATDRDVVIALAIGSQLAGSW
jgi:hypothetical protein